MNLHNGSLDIESGEGVGTTVTLTFPVYKEGSENSLPKTLSFNLIISLCSLIQKGTANG